MHVDLLKSSDKVYFELLPTDKHCKKLPLFIKKQRSMIGSSNVCDIIIKDDSITAIHAVIEITKETFKIFDMNTKHGTFHNGKKVIHTVFKVGDRLRFANIEYVFKNYNRQDIPALPLEMLELNKSREVPEIKKETTEEKIQESLHVEYPLASDPRADYTEYIFEDAHTVYPIFDYSCTKNSIEVIILFRDTVFSVDYFTEKEGPYYIVGSKPSDSRLEYPQFQVHEKYIFMEISNHDIRILSLPGFKLLEQDGKQQSTQVYLQNDEVVRLSKEDIQIFIRKTQHPPKIKHAPLIRRDKEFMNLFMTINFILFIFVGGLFFYQVDKKIEKAKAPERIARILYKKKKRKVVKRKVKVRQAKEQKKVVSAPKKKSILKKVKKITQQPKKKVQAKAPKPSPKIAPKITATKSSQKKKVTVSKKAKKGSQNFFDSSKIKNLNSMLTKGSKQGSVRSKSAELGLGKNIKNGSVDHSSGSLKKGRLRKGNHLQGSVKGSLDTNIGRLSSGDRKHNIQYAAEPFTKTLIGGGGLSASVIEKGLRDHLNEMQSCYQRELDISYSDFQARAQLRFTISGTGRVRHAEVIFKRKTKQINKIRRCISNVLKGILYPEPDGKIEVSVNTYLNLSSRK